MRESKGTSARTERALIIGDAGQDGRLMRLSLAEQGVAVTGLRRDGIVDAAGVRVGGPLDIFRLEEVCDFLRQTQPDEIYYLAARHNSSEGAIDFPARLLQESLKVNVEGLTNFLEAITRVRQTSRLFYAGSSHMFGAAQVSPQDEETPFVPINAYAISKVAGASACRLYRRDQGVFVSVGILYNHESSLRRDGFVSRKIVRAVGEIARGKGRELRLANLDAVVDWGYAPDYVKAMQMILRHHTADDFVLASGTAHSIRDFCDLAFRVAGFDYRDYVQADASLPVRGQPPLLGNASKLHREVGWAPQVAFSEMVRILVENELAPDGPMNAFIPDIGKKQ